MLVISRWPPQNSYRFQENHGMLLIVDEQKNLNSIFIEKCTVDMVRKLLIANKER